MTKGTNILHTEASDGWGGQEIRILDEMLGMKERGYGVMLAAPAHAKILSRATRVGIQVFAVGMGKLSFIPGVIKLKKIIRDRHVSIVNTHSSRDSWMGSMAGRLAGVPVIRSRHISSRLKGDPLTRFVYNRLVDAVVTTGESVRERLLADVGVSPEKVYSIPTGIDLGRFADADGTALRASLGIGPDERVLGVAAVLRSWKGHRYVIQAMPEILKSFPGARLVLAGEGPARERLEDLVGQLGLEGSVHMIGYREDIPDVIAAFDVSILASFASEGIPQFVLQSMASGKPVIGTTTGGIPEVVKEGVNGMIVPPKDPSALAAAVRRMLGDPDAMRRMGEAGREMAAKGHSRDRMLDGIEDLYGKLIP